MIALEDLKPGQIVRIKDANEDEFISTILSKSQKCFYIIDLICLTDCTICESYSKTFQSYNINWTVTEILHTSKLDIEIVQEMYLELFL